MQKKRYKLIEVFQSISFVSLITLALLLLLLHISVRSQEFEQRAELIRGNYLHQQKALIKNEVMQVVVMVQRHHLQQQQIIGQRTRAKVDLLTAISAIRFGEDGYVFVNRLNGDALVANGKVVSGTKKLWEVFAKNPDKTKALFAQEYAAALNPDGDFIYYSLSKISDPTTEYPKVAFIFGLPEQQWLVGAGVYLDNAEVAIAALQLELEQQQSAEITRTFLLAGAIIVFTMFLFHLVSIRLKQDLALIGVFFDQVVHSDKEIEVDKIKFAGMANIATRANTMLRDRLALQKKMVITEEKYRTFFDTGTVGFFRSRLSDGLYLDVNKKAAEHIGYEVKDVIGKIKTVDLYQDLAQRKEFLARLATDGYVNDFEVDLLLPNGQAGSYSISVKAYPENDYLEGVAVDITARKQAEAELFKLRKLESVGILAGGIAHDFNNLLAGLFGNIEMAKRSLSVDDRAYRYLDSAVISMERATSLTQQLLTFSKGGDPVKENLSLKSVIVETAEFSLRGSKVKLQLNIAPDLWLVDADKGQLSQVISNLVINANQAMPAGGHVIINAENIVSAGETQVQISVQDQGIGIAPQYLDKIFDPYFTTKQQGSGLGLASCHSIISKHHGTIVVASELDQGAVFTITLPAAKEQKGVAVVVPEAVPNTAKATDSVHILVLDDDELVLQMSSAMLEEMGYRVDYAVCGEAAVEKYRYAQAKGCGYDIVICDLTIPGGMGGQEAAGKIIQLDPQAKIIVSSGYATDPVLANYAEYGFVGRVAKPYLFAELQQAIQVVLEG